MPMHALMLYLNVVVIFPPDVQHLAGEWPTVRNLALNSNPGIPRPF